MLDIRHPLVPVLVLLLFLALGAYQLHLPGLHYDEAKEAGLNAMELVTGQPLTLFREAGLKLGPWQVPLMVQDYIGALNVWLAVPFLALGGVNVVALRWLPLLLGGLTLLLVWRVGRLLEGPLGALIASALLAVNPSFVFWSRQGIFVTNLTALLFMASLFTGLRWWAGRRGADLCWTGLFWGLGIYAKLLFGWVVGAMGVAALGAWAGIRLSRRAHRQGRARPVLASAQQRWMWPVAAVCVLLPLIPLLLFNLQTEGTLRAVLANLGRSYYGVDNRAYWPNLLVRLGQVRTLLRGDHLWYLGGVFANRWAPFLAGGLVVAAVVAGVAGLAGARGALVGERWAVFVPVGLLILMVAQSAFTVSDLFITHYVVLLPLIPLAGGLAAVTLLAACRRRLSRWLTAGVWLAVLWWGGADLWSTARYHQALTQSGGHASHSSAIADLSGYLGQQTGLAPVVVLDWGMAAQVRFLTAGQVSPIEVFGYASLEGPDPGFADRVAPFLSDPGTLYLAHTPEDTVFQGRVESLAALAAQRGLSLCREECFHERSGRPVFIVYRVGPQC